jgi:K+-transporting ATPase ATPase A chain
MLQSVLIYGVALLLAWPLGLYLAKVMRGAPLPADGLFAIVERPLYRLIGTDPLRTMSCGTYVRAFLVCNLLLAVPVWLVFMTQAALPLNPNGAPNMRWDLALHTMVSFLTNTNQQHYSGQAQLSYLAQMTGIVGLQIITPMMGLAVACATLRALMAPPCPDLDVRQSLVNVGNFWGDLIRPALRVFLPLLIVLSVLLTAQGVPATLAGGPAVATLDPAGEQNQKIPLGPVAPMVAAKQLGTNGGGWYGPNSAVALENPTPLSNAVETVSIVLLPMAVAFMVGPFTGRRRFGWLVVGTMLGLSLLSAGASLWTETQGVVATGAASMEGKETRLGVEASALWASFTTQTSNGSVNAMHDSLAPLTGLLCLVNMIINAICGGIGCGLSQWLAYLLMTVFIAGLMTGRTPELFGRKIEAAEVRVLAVLVVLPPLVTLGLTAVTLHFPSLTANSNPGYHGISQVYYEFTSAFANNGSGFEGLGDNTPWWNLACTVALIAGRFPALLLPLVIAAMLGARRQAPEGAGSLRVETPTFAFALIGVMVILTLLQFTPVLVLGPVAEHLSLAHS